MPVAIDRKQFSKDTQQQKKRYLETNDVNALKKIEASALNGDPFQRSYALGEIAGIGRRNEILPESTKAVLLTCLDSSEPVVRREAAIAISDLKGDFPEAIPKLIGVIANFPDSDAASFATRTLGKMKAREALPVLKKALSSQYEKIRHEAKQAIDEIESVEVKP